MTIYRIHRVAPVRYYSANGGVRAQESSTFLCGIVALGRFEVQRMVMLAVERCGQWRQIVYMYAFMTWLQLRRSTVANFTIYTTQNCVGSQIKAQSGFWGSQLGVFQSFFCDKYVFHNNYGII